MKPTWIVLTTSIFLCASTVQADFIGLNIGANHWAPALTGSFNSSGNDSISLKSLSLDDPSQTSLSLIFEHPVPFLPNIKFQGFDLDSSGVSDLSNVQFNDTTFGADTRSTLDLSHNEIALYYEVLDNWINLDVGIDLKRFDGEASLSSGTSSERIDIDETIPLLYLSARFDLPFTGFYVGADFNNLSIGDNSIEDSTLKLGFESSYGLGIEGGLKVFSLKLDDVENLDTDLEYDGLFLNGYYHF